MSPLFKVDDLVVRNPEVRGTSGWPYGDEVCRVVDDYPHLGTVIDVVPVNSPPNKRYQGTGWLADRFTPAHGIKENT